MSPLDHTHSEKSSTALDRSPSGSNEADSQAAQQKSGKTATTGYSGWNEKGSKKTKGYRKNATLDNERSSRMVREEAKMFRRTAGVTGMRLEGLSGEGERGARADG